MTARKPIDSVVGIFQNVQAILAALLRLQVTAGKVREAEGNAVMERLFDALRWLETMVAAVKDLRDLEDGARYAHLSRERTNQLAERYGGAVAGCPAGGMTLRERMLVNVRACIDEGLALFGGKP